MTFPSKLVVVVSTLTLVMGMSIPSTILVVFHMPQHTHTGMMSWQSFFMLYSFCSLRIFLTHWDPSILDTILMIKLLSFSIFFMIKTIGEMLEMILQMPLNPILIMLVAIVSYCIIFQNVSLQL
jgi:uncharacterized protein Usg